MPSVLTTVATIGFFTASSIVAIVAEAKEEKSLSVPFPCTQDWTGPSYDNTFDCSANQISNWINENPAVWSTIIPAALGILLLFPCAFVVLASRYFCNCLGSHKMRPSSVCGCDSIDDQLSPGELHSRYSTGCIRFVKFFSIALIATAVSGVVFCYFGGVQMQKSVDNATPTVNNIADWALSVIADTKAGIAMPSTGNSSDPVYPPGFDISQFENVESDIRRYQHDVTDNLDKYKDDIKIGTQVISYFSIGPALILLLPALAAVCNIRRCLPFVFIVLSYLFQFVYMCFATICLALVVTMGTVCDDFSLVLNPSDAPVSSKASLTEWYLIPECDHTAPFEDINTNVLQMENEAAVRGCEALLGFCSPSAVYDAVNAPKIIFQCVGLTDATTDCPTFANLTAITDAMVMKTGVPAEAGCGASNDNCTLDVCAQNCTNSDVREAAASAVSDLATGTRVINTFNNVLKPWLNCRALIKKVLTSGALDACHDIENASRHLRNGSLIVGCGLIAAIFFGLLGQKRYINKSRVMHEEGFTSSVGMGNQYGGTDKIGGDYHAPMNRESYQ